MSIDKKRISAVTTLEAAGWEFKDNQWQAPPFATQLPLATHAHHLEQAIFRVWQAYQQGGDMHDVIADAYHQSKHGDRAMKGSGAHKCDDHDAGRCTGGKPVRVKSVRI